MSYGSIVECEFLYWCLNVDCFVIDDRVVLDYVVDVVFMDFVEEG